MSTIEESNKIFRAEGVNISLSIFWLLLRLSVLAFLFTYYFGNKFVFKNNIPIIKYVKIIGILFLILAIISLLSAFAIWSEVDS